MRMRPPLLWIRGFITWLTYTLSGLLAVSLAAPNELASPLYLPAGLALIRQATGPASSKKRPI